MIFRPIINLILAITFIAVLWYGWQIVKEKNVSDGSYLQVYFFNQEKLHPVPRKIVSQNDKVRQAIQDLMKGPTEEESSKGLFSLIPKDFPLKGLRKQEDTLIFILEKTPENISGGQALIEGLLAQLVFTAMQFPEIKQVRFELADQPDKQIVLGGEGYIIENPLTKAYFKRSQ